MLFEKVLNTITQHKLINKGDRVVVGLSGGPDSVCLVHVLNTLRETFDLKLYAIHINHMLRGAEADDDETYARELCQSLGIEFYSVSRDVAAISKEFGVSVEEAGREARYKAFDQYADRVGAGRVAVAHNRDDQAETVLMHIIRGSGITGLAGMDYTRGRIIRPLLDVQRSEIEEYCRQNSLNPRLDRTNLQNIYARNKIRLDIIPEISRAFGVNFSDSLIRLSLLASQDNDYIERTAAEVYEGQVGSRGEGYVHMELASLKGLHPAILGRLLRRALNEAAGSIKGIENKHIDSIRELIERGATGPVIQLPSGIRATISYKLLKIYIEKEMPFGDFERLLDPAGVTKIPELDAEIAAEVLDKPESVDKYSNIRYNSLVQFFDYGSLLTGINIRNRREGDLFKPLKSNGTKKLKEYFIDLKVPREERTKIPLIAKDKEIVWIVGYKISDKFKVTENTKIVLKLEWRVKC